MAGFARISVVPDFQDAGGLGDGGALAGHPLQLTQLGRADGAGPADVLFAGQPAAFGLAAAGGGGYSGLPFGAQLEFVFAVLAAAAEYEAAITLSLLSPLAFRCCSTLFIPAAPWPHPGTAQTNSARATQPGH